MENIILDEIEDDQPDGKIPSTTRHYLSRYILCLVWLFGLLQFTFHLLNYFGTIGFNDLLFIITLRIGIPVYSIYYHLVHGYMEQKQKFYTPKFPLWMTGLTIGILALNLLGNIITTLNDISYSILTFSTSLHILFVFCAAVILRQEIKYYKWQR